METRVKGMQDTIDHLEAKLEEHGSKVESSLSQGQLASTSVADIENSMGGDSLSAGLNCQHVQALWNSQNDLPVTGAMAQMNAVPIRDGAKLMNIQKTTSAPYQ